MFNQVTLDIEWKLLKILFNICQWLTGQLFKIQDYVNERHAEILRYASEQDSEVVMTTQFSGESPWDAVVQDNSLDIVEEELFYEFCTTRTSDDPHKLDLVDLEILYDQWEEQR